MGDDGGDDGWAWMMMIGMMSGRERTVEDFMLAGEQKTEELLTEERRVQR